MKKALVLGVLAIFAIGIANVNAQDRTNVQEKPKKTYSQDPAAKKNMDTKAINSTKEKDPTAKAVPTKEGGKTAVTGIKGGNKVGKPAINTANKPSDPKAINGTSGKTPTGTVIGKDEPKTASPTSEAVGKDDPKSKKVSTSKELKSVPPTPKEKKPVQPAADVNDK